MIEIKICGLCRPEDAAAAARLGADYVGVILAPNRARSQSFTTAATIYAEAGEARRVGVFIDPELSTVASAVHELELDVVQLHGHESIGLIRAVGALASVWKAIPVGASGALVESVNLLAPEVDAILLDSLGGGTGHAFDWTQAASLVGSFPDDTRFAVAGGLTPSNVAAAIQTMMPDVVDVSSGIESHLCVKSHELMEEFIEAAHAAWQG